MPRNDLILIYLFMVPLLLLAIGSIAAFKISSKHSQENISWDGDYPSPAQTEIITTTRCKLVKDKTVCYKHEAKVGVAQRYKK